MFKNRAKSAGRCRRDPSAMLVGTEVAALRSCDVTPKRPSAGNAWVKR